MSVVGSLDYGFWSSYQDRHGQSPAMYGPDLAWRDTMSGALGVRHEYKDARAFVDRFVPRYQQKDSSRIVDELPDGSVFGNTHDPVPGASGLQTNNPGWPGFSSGGWIWGGAVTLSMPL